jgi:hypothetical protein
MRMRPSARHSVCMGMLVTCVSVTSVAAANRSLTDLGKPLNVTSTQSYYPLDGFHKIDGLPTHGKVVLLFIGASGNYYRLDNVAMERWPIVKTLEQFGTLSNVRSVSAACTTIAPGSDGPYFGEWCAAPTYDFSRARYKSNYVTFVSRDILKFAKDHAKVFQKLNASARAVFNKYVAYRGKMSCKRPATGKKTAKTCASGAARLAAVITSGTPRTLPLTAVGDYGQTISQVLSHGLFDQTIPMTATPTVSSNTPAIEERELSFAEIRDALATGKDPVVGSNLVEAVNAEVNIMTAIICRQDGNKPRAVCRRSAVRTIERAIK